MKLLCWWWMWILTINYCWIIRARYPTSQQASSQLYFVPRRSFGPVRLGWINFDILPIPSLSNWFVSPINWPSYQSGLWWSVHVRLEAVWLLLVIIFNLTLYYFFVCMAIVFTSEGAGRPIIIIYTNIYHSQWQCLQASFRIINSKTHSTNKEICQLWSFI